VIRYTILFAGALLAGCSVSTGAQPTLAPLGSLAAPPIKVLTQARTYDPAPATCDKGVHVRMDTHTGSFRLPPCAGWKGLIRYPTFHGPEQAKTVSHWTMTTSVTNMFGAPAPPSGTPLFFMQMHLDRPVDWEFPNADVTDTVTSPAFTSSHTYTLIVYNFVDDNRCDDTPCPPWVLNLDSPQPGGHSITFSSPLNGAHVGGGPLGAPVWQFIQN
jgi:hypothetical protein